MEVIGNILPVGMVFLIFILKLLINEKVSLENLKRLCVEVSVDLLSLAISFIISYIIAISNKIVTLENQKDITDEVRKDLSSLWRQFGGSVITLFIYIVVLIINVFVVKFFIEKYNNKEGNKYITYGVLFGYILAIPCLVYAILLLTE